MSNALTRAAHGLSLQEKRLLMLAISKLDSKLPATPQNMVVEVNVTEFASAYGITSKTLYGEAKIATEQLMNRYIRFRHGKSETRMQWVGRATYKEGEGVIELVFWHELSPMLFELERQFTSYKLGRAGGLRSKYAWRLFELLMQFKKTGYLKITLDDFHHSMDTPKSMRSKFTNLTARVLEPAIKEIRLKDGLKVTWTALKKGRKVTSLEFKFPVEPQHELFKIDKDFIDKNARPGESYEQAGKRLKEEAKKQTK
ncbi:replication initiation protein [Leucothrix pacifica]|nr:replication initiation protein [Leucothrix pacifica]